VRICACRTWPTGAYDLPAFDLSDAEMKAISGLNIHLRLNNPVDIDNHLA
jgi:hypothetical protein